MAEDRLERALGAWSSAYRLPDADRERIRAAVVTAPSVDRLWWARFNTQIDGVVALVTSLHAGTKWADVASQGLPRMAWGCAA